MFCDYCGDEWHGPPKFLENRSCPGSGVSPEVIAVWHEMFPPPSVTRHERIAALPKPGNWKFPPAVIPKIHTNAIDLNGEFRIALFKSHSNISSVDRYQIASGEHPSTNGYTTGGICISLARAIGRMSVDYTFTSNPVWTATGFGIKARYAAVYAALTGEVLAHCHIGDVHARGGSTLSIDNSHRPIFTKC